MAEEINNITWACNKQMDNIISNRADIPKRMTLVKKRFFVKKTLVKEMLSVITDQCHASFKLMTGIIADSIYNFLDVNDKLPVEQKVYKKKSWGAKINY